MAERMPAAPQPEPAPAPAAQSTSGKSTTRPTAVWMVGGGAAAVAACLGLGVLVAIALAVFAGGLPGAATPATATSPPFTPVPTRPTLTIVPSATPVAELGDLIFEDDFSDPESGWDRVETDQSLTDYHQGAYRIRVDEPQIDTWANPGRVFNDVRLAVRAIKAGGPDDNDFGVICRYRDAENFYAFLISSDGFYAIQKFEDGERTSLGFEGMRPSPFIHQGAAENEILAECIGDRLGLWVNGVLLLEVHDSTFSAGDVGLIAGTFDESGVDIHFDDLALYSP
jgi:hypothetical protein